MTETTSTATDHAEDDVVFYHGTRKGFRGRGGLVIPRSSHGGPGTTAPLNPGREQPADAADWVYLTTDLDLAWVYAWHAAGRGQPKVLAVRPLEALEPDPEHSAAMTAWRCKAAVVDKVLTDPTVTEADARSGWVFTGSDS